MVEHLVEAQSVGSSNLPLCPILYTIPCGVVFMNTEDLIKILKSFPGNVEVYFPDGSEVTGAEVTLGKLKEGYYTNYFTIHPKGKIKGVMFTHFTELSTGECVNCIKRS